MNNPGKGQATVMSRAEALSWIVGLQQTAAKFQGLHPHLLGSARQPSRPEFFKAWE